jgi:hypothetical protein
MDCDEKPLREMLMSAHGGGVGQCLIDKVAGGEPIVIAMLDGSKMLLTESAEAVQVLVERFGWRREIPDGGIDWRSDKAAAYILGMCQRVERGFTLREIVARVQSERPEMILEFAATWGRLIRNKMIRILREAEPCLYEVGSEQPSSRQRSLGRQSPQFPA